MDLKSFIREIPDYPKPGINFKDITPLCSDGRSLANAIKGLAEPYVDKGITVVAGIESRGFVFGTPVALQLGVGFVLIRKKGKLPWRTRNISYELEYGSDQLEVHADAFSSSDRVLLVDDLLATGGTAKAASLLIKGSGAKFIGASFLIELESLDGKNKFGLPYHSVLRY